jgi:hypothetical protein
MPQTAIFAPMFATTPRFYLYLVSSLALWFIAGRAALAYLAS